MVPTGWCTSPYNELNPKHVTRVFWRSSHCKRFVTSMKLWFDVKWFFCGAWLKITYSVLEWLIIESTGTINLKMLKKVLLSMNAGKKSVVPTLAVMWSIYCSFDAILGIHKPLVYRWETQAIYIFDVKTSNMRGSTTS